MKIEISTSSITIWLNERYAIYKHRDLKMYWLQDYRFGTDHMPEEIYADDDLLKVYEIWMKMEGKEIK